MKTPKSGLKLYNDVVAVAAVVHIFDCDLTSDWLSSSGILYLNIPLPPFMSLVLGSDGFLILTVLPTSMKWFSLFVILAATFGCGDSRDNASFDGRVARDCVVSIADCNCKRGMTNVPTSVSFWHLDISAATFLVSCFGTNVFKSQAFVGGGGAGVNRLMFAI